MAAEDSQARILIVEDEEDMRELLLDLLSQGGDGENWVPRAVGRAEEALSVLEREHVDLVVSDLRLAGMSGTDLLDWIKVNKPEVQVIIITAFGTIDNAVECMRRGAYHYLSKPFNSQAVVMTVKRALEEHRLRLEVARLRRELTGRYRLGDMIGRSAAMQRVFDLIARIAPTERTVLITGESGSGKDMVARAIHAHSQRSAGTFVTVNCAAIPGTLLESELFGHIRGAFTDAREGRKGLFQSADGGTIFLDEIAEIPVDLQAKLLHVVENKVVRPVGSNREEAIDVRILAATNADIEREVEEGSFRSDLYYRINVVTIEIPPLRGRVEDIPLLANHFLVRACRELGRPELAFSREALRFLVGYYWPGNVRELQNVAYRAAALATGGEVGPGDLPVRITKPVPARVSTGSRLQSLADLERSHILSVLEFTGGNKTEAAAILGIDRKTLYRKLDEYGR